MQEKAHFWCAFLVSHSFKRFYLPLVLDEGVDRGTAEDFDFDTSVHLTMALGVVLDDGVFLSSTGGLDT